MSIKCIHLFALCALAGTTAADASSILKIKPLTPPAATAAAAASTVDAYYYTPEGVTFSGLNKEGTFDGDFAYAPANKWLSTAAEVRPEDAEFQWSFPSAISESGKITMSTSSSRNFQFRMRSACTVPAPVLTATSGCLQSQYALAADGVKYGEYGTWQNFAVNYQPSRTTQIGQANELLATNDDDARTLLNFAMAGGIFTDITVYGFSESFYNCGSFYLQAVNALLYSEQTLTASDIAIKVFRREKTSVFYDDEVAHLSVAELTPLSDNRYYVEFRCDGEAPFIQTAVQVVILPAEGSDAKFSPMLPLQKQYRASNMGTASLYATFKFMGKNAKVQCMDFFGTEVSNEDNTTAGFLNHWAIGLKGSYEKPAGISDVLVDAPAMTDSAVYSITGVKVGTVDDFERLSAGIYICGGKKLIKR